MDVSSPPSMGATIYIVNGVNTQECVSLPNRR
jgi:hypothetical protein